MLGFWRLIGIASALVLVCAVSAATLGPPGEQAPIVPPTTTTLAPFVFPVFEQDRTVADVVAVAAFFEDETRREEQAAVDAYLAELAAAKAARPPVVRTPAPVAVSAPAGDVWARLRQCESGGNYETNTGNGYYGAYQFLRSTWRGVVDRAGLGEWADVLPSDAPPHVQDAAARQLQSERGWQPWPGCSRKLGLS